MSQVANFFKKSCCITLNCIYLRMIGRLVDSIFFPNPLPLRLNLIGIEGSKKFCSKFDFSLPKAVFLTPKLQIPTPNS